MANTKIEISLTDFVDFVCKSGSTKLTQVKKVKYRDPYSPATDFYKGLREGLITLHQNSGSKKGLKNILDSISDPKKVVNYTEAIDGYKKFWGKKEIDWFDPPFKHWSTGELDVRINPELGLEFEGKFFIIKLYFKSEKLSKSKIDQILTLLEGQLRKEVEEEIQMAVLDIKNSKLYVKNDTDISLLPLLEGEARSFETIWKNI